MIPGIFANGFHVRQGMSLRRKNALHAMTDMKLAIVFMQLALGFLMIIGNPVSPVRSAGILSGIRRIRDAELIAIVLKPQPTALRLYLFLLRSSCQAQVAKERRLQFLPRFLQTGRRTIQV
ncbi:hypothetical protein CH371_05595 [Leptospira wolffii]|uniref:Uncharacterized protein n=1 Tax=Leptospira wolffii TaxID=409998 RepID=A0A2M9ZGJ0_9LEPT|nr:hypothetical protein CH371_05595 [Leptospira wolffii]